MILKEPYLTINDSAETLTWNLRAQTKQMIDYLKQPTATTTGGIQIQIYIISATHVRLTDFNV